MLPSLLHSLMPCAETLLTKTLVAARYPGTVPALFCLLLGCYAVPEHQQQIQAALDRVDTEAFFLPTAIASGRETVRDVLWQTPELQLLLHKAPEAIPEIVHRLTVSRGVLHDQTRIALFLVIQKAGDQRATSAVLHYLDSLPDQDAKQIDSPWHPFLYAVDALHALVPELTLPKTSAQLFRQRHAIVGQAHSKLKTRK